MNDTSVHDHLERVHDFQAVLFSREHIIHGQYRIQSIPLLFTTGLSSVSLCAGEDLPRFSETTLHSTDITVHY